MARRKGRIKDKWREKRWVNVNAPDSFNNVPIAYVPITDDENASGRVIEITLFDILKGDPSQHQYKLYFQIDKVDEKMHQQFSRDLNIPKNFYEVWLEEVLLKLILLLILKQKMDMYLELK